MPDMPRDDFYREVVTLSDLIDGGAPFLSDRRFRRCLIRGDEHLKVMIGNRFLFCSVADKPPGRRFLELAEGARLSHTAILLIECKFEECWFEKATFTGTAQDKANLMPAFETMSESEWRAKYRLPL